MKTDFLISFLVGFNAVLIVWLFMKTLELQSAVSALASQVSGLKSSVDAAVALLINQAPSTPDADIVPLLGAITDATSTLAEAKSKLDAATAPPTTTPV